MISQLESKLFAKYAAKECLLPQTEMDSEGRFVDRKNQFNTYIKVVNECRKWFTHMLPRKAPLRIATYNVHFWTNPYRKFNGDAIVRNIIDSKADIVCLQEVLINEKSKALMKKLENDGGYKFQYFAPANSRNFGNMILLREPMASNIKSTHAKQISISSDPTRRGMARVHVKLGDVSVIIFSIHLEVDDRDVQLKQMQRAGEIIDKDLANKKKDQIIVVCGDFNAQAHEYPKVHKELTKRGFEMSYESLPQFTCWSGDAIDFIYTRTQGSVELEKKNTNVYLDPASDHLMIVADYGIVKLEDED